MSLHQVLAAFTLISLLFSSTDVTDTIDVSSSNNVSNAAPLPQPLYMFEDRSVYSITSWIEFRFFAKV